MKAVFIQRLGPQAASFRYRSAIPAAHLGASVNGGEAQVLVFSKPLPPDLEMATAYKADGVKIVVDYCDDHFRHPKIGPIYVEMAKLADRIVVPTENMSGRVKKYLDRHADAIIGDPYEEPLSDPHANGAGAYLWFGNPANLKDLAPYLPLLDGKDLTIVTGEHRGLDREWLQWTPAVQTAELRKANIVLLPTRKGVEYKSANRLINALRSGCFPVCGGLPSYYEFRQFAMVADNFKTALAVTHEIRHELDDRVKAGQAYIEKYSPASIGEQWRHVLEDVCQ